MGLERWGWGAVALGLGLAVGWGKASTDGGDEVLETHRVALRSPARSVTSGVLVSGGREVVLVDVASRELRRYGRSGRYLGNHVLPEEHDPLFLVRSGSGYRVQTREGRLLELDGAFRIVHIDPVPAPEVHWPDLDTRMRESLSFLHGYVPGWGYLVDFDGSERNAWGLLCRPGGGGLSVPSRAEHLVAFGDFDEIVFIEDHRTMLTLRFRPTHAGSSLLRSGACVVPPTRRSGRGKTSGLVSSGVAPFSAGGAKE